MYQEIFLATNNAGKIERFKNLLNHAKLEITVYSPQDFQLEKIEVEENGKNLSENAEIKARAYWGKVPLPILANDTGFWVSGEGLVEAPKRITLGNARERDLTKEELAEKILQFWKAIAQKNGGKVDAAWVEEFALLTPEGKIQRSGSRREVVLTDQEFGTPHIQMPIRALYLSKTTGKPAIQHTKEEELAELEPITNALIQLLKK